MHGEIKALNERNFGFILGQDGQEFFFHSSSLAPGTSFHDLTEGDTVSFSEVPSPKGPRAASVALVQEPGPIAEPAAAADPPAAADDKP